MCIIFSTITVSNGNPNNSNSKNCTFAVTIELTMVWDSQNQLYFLFFTLLGQLTSVNNVVVTVLYLLRALHRRIIVYRILYKNQRIRASLAKILNCEK